MKSKRQFSIRMAVFILIMLSVNPCVSANQNEQNSNGMPQLVKHGKVTQLYVDEKPFLIIGGELNNSTSSSLENMKPIWQLVTDLNFNTVITPLSWELIEPRKRSDHCIEIQICNKLPDWFHIQ